MSNFDLNPLTSDLTLFPVKNSPNSAKSNHIFTGKERGDRNLLLTFLDSPMAEVFLVSIYIFRFRSSSGENWRLELQKCKLWSASLFHKTSNLSKVIQTSFLSVRVLPLV